MVQGFLGTWKAHCRLPSSLRYEGFFESRPMPPRVDTQGLGFSFGDLNFYCFGYLDDGSSHAVACRMQETPLRVPANNEPSTLNPKPLHYRTSAAPVQSPSKISEPRGPASEGITLKFYPLFYHREYGLSDVEICWIMAGPFQKLPNPGLNSGFSCRFGVWGLGV